MMMKDPRPRFEEIAKNKAHTNIVLEFWGFLKQNKKWWLLPILVLLLLFGTLMILSGTAVAPFIYTLF